MHVDTDNYKLKRKRGRKGIKQINEGESRRGVINKTGTRKNCAKWTVDLHSKFRRAVEQLGQGKCYPADIVKVMNVPGLTRKLVSSHLQQDIGEQNMFDPSNIVANDIEGSDPNEWKYWDAFVDYNPMGDLFQNPTSPSATLPNEYG
ncbi:hypothetical protein MTR67_053692, partial [Solanum verrucosum]